MAWPPLIPPAGRTNSTVELDAHPNDHNAIVAALTDIVTQVNTMARGRVASITSAAVTAGIGAEATILELANVALLAGRRYRVWFTVNLGTAAGGTAYGKITDGANATLQLWQQATWAANGMTLGVCLEVPPASARSVTYRGRLAVVGTTATLQGGAGQPHQLLVEDIGI